MAHHLATKVQNWYAQQLGPICKHYAREKAQAKEIRTLEFHLYSIEINIIGRDIRSVVDRDSEGEKTTKGQNRAFCWSEYDL